MSMLHEHGHAYWMYFPDLIMSIGLACAGPHPCLDLNQPWTSSWVLRSDWGPNDNLVSAWHDCAVERAASV